jgi:hypothetical protein
MKNSRLMTLLLVGYLVAIVLLMLARNMAITPDRFFVILLFGALIIGRGKLFLRDWVPFIALLLGYELVRGFADTAGFRVHISELVNAEMGIFGVIPTVELQKLFFDPNNVRLWDIGAVIIDFLHFPLPLAVAFYFWMKDKKAYWRFVFALLVLSFSAFLTYLFYPAAPPWYASQKAGLIEVYKIVDFVVADVGWGWDFSQIYNNLNPNPVAAMPSLHSAYPWLAFLALRSINKKLALYFLPYPILVWTSVVYLGEHYIIDVIAGVAYASIAYFVIFHFAKIKALAQKLSRQVRLEDGKSGAIER